MDLPIFVNDGRRHSAEELGAQLSACALGALFGCVHHHVVQHVDGAARQTARRFNCEANYRRAKPLRQRTILYHLLSRGVLANGQLPLRSASNARLRQSVHDGHIDEHRLSGRDVKNEVRAQRASVRQGVVVLLLRCTRQHGNIGLRLQRVFH